MSWIDVTQRILHDGGLVKCEPDVDGGVEMKGMTAENANGCTKVINEAGAWDLVILRFGCSGKWWGWDAGILCLLPMSLAGSFMRTCQVQRKSKRQGGPNS